MSEPTPTIIDLKLAFLRTQIQALSAPTRIPPSYRPNDQPIRQKAINDALFELNAKIQQHSKLVYSNQAQRHVAEQIDALYWMAGDRHVNGGADERLEIGADLSNEAIINSMPEVWDEPVEAQRLPQEAGRYILVAQQLQNLNQRRAELKARIAKYKEHKKMLELLDDPKENVQENLCTKDGDVEAELQRMRMLLARVQGRLETQDEGQSHDDGMELDAVDGEKRVKALFDS